MPIKGYIAGRPVSRWDAETDNIDIDYRNLDGRGLGPCRCLEECQSGKKGCVVKILVCVVLFSVGLIIGYVIRRNVHEKIIAKTPPCPPAAIIKHTIQDFNQTVSDEIKKRLDHTPNYNLTLYDYSTYIRLAGMPLNNQGLSSTKKWLETFEPDPVFDSIKMKSYSVTLSYPDMASPTLSYVGIVDNGTEVFRSHSNATVDHREYMAFSAYSPSKTVQGKLVYVNYGCVEDFRMLESRGVIVNNTIVIIRYGKIHPGNKVKHAEDWGALGVVLYPDPYDFANQQTSASSDSWWLPGWAIQSQHVRAELSGDPTFKGTDFSGTPGGPEGSKSYPSIPVQPINYDDATELLKNLGGDLVDMDWKGSLPVEYNSGPGYMGEDNNRTVKLFVRNIIQQRLINNLLAVIHGQYEKDQYVIVGAHHDSFSWGTIDAGTGYAVLIELAKSFGRYRKNGWRPRRTIIFAFWDASKYGHIGAYEWVQSNAKQLGAGAVAYINLDSLIRGNYSFYAESSPMLRDVVLAAARSVACADPEHGPGTSLYDMWARKLPREDTDPEQPVPKVPSLGGDSDYAPFLYYLGVPSLAPAYTYNLNAFNTLPNYPAYSTLYDMYNYLIRHVDPELRLTTTVSKVIAEVTLRLSDSAILPLSVAQLGDVMEDGWNSIQTFISGFKDNNISLEKLRTTINEFKDTAGNFTACVKSINVSTWNEWDIRTVNNQMLRVSRVFIVDAGLPSTPHYRHTLMSPHPENLNSQLVFPGVLGPLLRGQSPREWAQVKEQLTILITSIQSAIDILNNSFIS